jgi:cullin-4
MKNDEVEIEKVFLELLKDHCGADYTKRMDYLIKDFDISHQISRALFSGKKTFPRYLNFLVISSENWQSLRPLLISPPSEVRTAQKAFERLYRSKNGGRILRWDLQLSEVKLNVTNVAGVQKVRCSGDYAAILLALNRKPRVTISQLADAIGSDSDEIEPKLHILLSKKMSKILVRRGSEVWISTNATAPNGKIRIPLFMQISSTSTDSKLKSSGVENQDSQIDAAVMFILKTEKSMDIESLKEMVKQQILGLENAVFDARLEKLQLQEFIRLEPSGRVHYLP